MRDRAAGPTCDDTLAVYTEAGCLDTAPDSDLAAQAVDVLVVAAADKQDFDGDSSQQYAGSLFEQSVLILGDGLFHSLWSTAGDTAQELWRNHANLE